MEGVEIFCGRQAQSDRFRWYLDDTLGYQIRLSADLHFADSPTLRHTRYRAPVPFCDGFAVSR